MICTQYFSGDKIEKNEMGGEGYTGVWCGNLKEIDHLGGLGVGGRTILRWIWRK